jgi:hypothetical protein
VVDGTSDLGIFSILELVSLYRVKESFGWMSTSEITKYAEEDGIYRFTAQDNFIPYEYARLLATAPFESDF